MKRKLQLKYSVILIVILLIITGLLLSGCGSAAPKTYTIGILNPSPNQETTIKGFKEGMTELGYVEGKNVTYVYQGPAAADKLDAVAQDLVKAKVDLILSITSPATQATQKATAGTAIPVLFIPITDPVGAGFVKSLTQPGGNLTGVAGGTPEGKRLEWLLQVAPTIKQIYIVYNPKNPSPVQSLKAVSEAAAKLGVKLITREIGTTDEAMAAFNEIPQEADAIFLLPDSMVTARSAGIYKIANELKLPTSDPNVTTVNQGALTAYGINFEACAKKQAARLANQILRGTKPADLPVEMAELSSAINLKTAQAIGIDIPDATLRQANTVVR
jgi:putative tryptophan/tyrosine transport system substrate-binding protein